MRDIVVTGMGIVSALGAGVSVTCERLMREQSGIGAMRYLPSVHTDLPVGEVPFSNDELRNLLQIPDNEIVTRTALLGRVALREALADANLADGTPLRVAFVSGTTVGGMEMSERFYSEFLAGGEHLPYLRLHDCGACTESVAGEWNGHFSFATTLSTACSSAANALILGAQLLETGRADIVVAGGTECLSKFHLNGFHTLMILDSEPCKPFDRDRHGLNLGEGAAYLVLEKAQTAQQRAQTPYGRLSGFGNRCDAFHQTATSPNGDGAYLAMCQALEDTELKPSEIDYVNAHGTGTPNNDESEAHALLRVFGEKMPLFSSTKAFTGHPTSAAGAIEAVISLLALQHQFVPANLNFTHPIESLNLTPVTHTLVNVPIRHVLSNSFGFGGNDSACVFSKINS